MFHEVIFQTKQVGVQAFGGGGAFFFLILPYFTLLAYFTNNRRIPKEWLSEFEIQRIDSH